VIRAIISDFGGVLTSPLREAFVAFEEQTGIPVEVLGVAMAALAERDGAHPLFELETGRMTEAAFLAALSGEVSSELGRDVQHLSPNQPLIDYMRELRARGYRMAICTNNVREWEPLWRAKLPVDEIFDHVVDSAFVGLRKPDPKIFELTLERLGVPAADALLLDDVELNCESARELGLTAIWFRSTEQAITEIEAALVER
jgi:putative hydrolase of the HAD superfamily